MRRIDRGVGRLAVLGFVIAIPFVGGCASSSPSQSLPLAVPMPPASDEEYAIQAGDMLAIRFYYHPDHDQNVVLVGNDGRIMLPLVGSVQVGGRKPSEVSRELETRYSSNLREPQIAVTIETVYRNLVWVGGEVKDPRFVEYRPGLTAMQAIVAAGGPRDTAALNETLLLHRAGRDEYQSSRLDLTKPIVEGDGQTDIVLNAQDVIFVPKTAIAKANVIVRQYIINMIPIRFTYRLDEYSRSSSSNSDESGQKNQTKSPPATQDTSSSSSTSQTPAQPR